MNIYYAPEIVKTPFLPEEESLHCVKVLRQKQGDVISVIDGAGTLYEVEIVNAHQKRTEVKILNCVDGFGSHPYRLHMAVAPTKSIDRFEWFVEKATEIGIDVITPLLCKHSERKVVKVDRTERIALSAAKQSYKALVPTIDTMLDFETFVKGFKDVPNCFIAHCYEMVDKPYLFDVCVPGKDVVVLVGPEGDFSEKEVRLAMDYGFRSVSLGESRLRTETAGVVAVHLVSVANSCKRD